MAYCSEIEFILLSIKALTCSVKLYSKIITYKIISVRLVALSKKRSLKSHLNGGRPSLARDMSPGKESVVVAGGLGLLVKEGPGEEEVGKEGYMNPAGKLGLSSDES